MSGRRVARRVAWTGWLNKPCLTATCAQTLATKVSDLLCQPFSLLRGGGRLGRGPHERALTGVRLPLGRGGGRRIESGEQLALTLSGWVVLVTKDIPGGGA